MNVFVNKTMRKIIIVMVKLCCTLLRWLTCWHRSETMGSGRDVRTVLLFELKINCCSRHVTCECVPIVSLYLCALAKKIQQIDIVVRHSAQSAPKKQEGSGL